MQTHMVNAMGIKVSIERKQPIYHMDPNNIEPILMPNVTKYVTKETKPSKEKFGADELEKAMSGFIKGL